MEKITIKWMSVGETNCAIQWIEIIITYLQSGTKVVDTIVSNGCFYQSFNSFIISCLLNAANPLTHPNQRREVSGVIPEAGPTLNV